MPTAIVTGSGGLVGSQSVIHCARRGWAAIGEHGITDVLRQIHDANVEHWTTA